jgi:hypothetical protein
MHAFHVSWGRRYVKIAGMASAKLVDEVRERPRRAVQIDYAADLFLLFR